VEVVMLRKSVDPRLLETLQSGYPTRDRREAGTSASGQCGGSFGCVSAAIRRIKSTPTITNVSGSISTVSKVAAFTA